MNPIKNVKKQVKWRLIHPLSTDYILSKMHIKVKSYTLIDY